MRSPSPRVAGTILFLCLVACDRQPEAVAVDLVAKAGPPVWTEFRIVPRHLELHHEDLGWIEQPVRADVDTGRLAGGLMQPLGRAELPPGTYDQIRVGFVHLVDRRTDPDSPPDISVVRDVAWILQPFCLVEGSQDARLLIDVFPAHPSAEVAAPTFALVDAPECPEDSAEEP